MFRKIAFIGYTVALLFGAISSEAASPMKGINFNEFASNGIISDGLLIDGPGNNGLAASSLSVDNLRVNSLLPNTLSHNGLTTTGTDLDDPAGPGLIGSRLPDATN